MSWSRDTKVNFQRKNWRRSVFKNRTCKLYCWWSSLSSLLSLLRSWRRIKKIWKIHIRMRGTNPRRKSFSRKKRKSLFLKLLWLWLKLSISTSDVTRIYSTSTWQGVICLRWWSEGSDSGSSALALWWLFISRTTRASHWPSKPTSKWSWRLPSPQSLKPKSPTLSLNRIQTWPSKSPSR